MVMPDIDEPAGAWGVEVCPSVILAPETFAVTSASC